MIGRSSRACRGMTSRPPTGGCDGGGPWPPKEHNTASGRKIRAPNGLSARLRPLVAPLRVAAGLGRLHRKLLLCVSTDDTRSSSLLGFGPAALATRRDPVFSASPYTGLVAVQTLDPVCGMRVRLDRPVAKIDHAGMTYLFCAVECKEAFEKDPGRYLEEPGNRLDLADSPALRFPDSPLSAPPASVLSPQSSVLS